jgi:hypothetical protein
MLDIDRPHHSAPPKIMGAEAQFHDAERVRLPDALDKQFEGLMAPELNRTCYRGGSLRQMPWCV